jgi:hypothetical protein
LNAVEIEEAISELADQPFDPGDFPFAFLEAFGNKATTIKRLKTGSSNSTDIEGGILQRNNIHMAVCGEGKVTNVLSTLKASPATNKAKAKFILATDGNNLEAEDLATGETVACTFADFPNHFGFFLPLAGITTVKQVRESSFDIRATSRLNKLYIELLKDNPDWGTADRRPDMNHFMARLIFCFFAEDTDIFHGENLFTATIDQMSERDSSNTHEVIGELFRAMNTKIDDREKAKLPRWANGVPYVNGGLFSGSTDVPSFSRIARSFLLHIGSLDWQKINPDIFGSMIQAVADDEERGALGMHYTSVPNILKVLDPLFLDDLRARLEEAGDNPRTLLNLRKRISKIRVFDPACGSGNFLVIAYKEMRAIEAEINNRRGDEDQRTEIPLTNFRGIELRDFPAEIARLALIIAEYQCDVHYRGQKEALAEFLPLDAMNWIACGNALRLDWLSICPPAGAGVKYQADDLFSTPLDQSQIDFENEGGETYVFGNPPYLGGKKQDATQKLEMKEVASGRYNHKNLDYICAFFAKAVDCISHFTGVAFVTTSSVNQGIHVPTFWPFVLSGGAKIDFCYEPFKWSNNAANNAGVYCTIIGLLATRTKSSHFIYFDGGRRAVDHINPYLVAGKDNIVRSKSSPISTLSKINTGNQAADGGYLFLTSDEKAEIESACPEAERLIWRVSGTSEFFDGRIRWCLWIDDEDVPLAASVEKISQRISRVLEFRSEGGEVAQTLTDRPHQFRYRNVAGDFGMIVPQVSSEAREYIPSGIFNSDLVVTHKAHAIFRPTFVDFSVFNSRMHFIWAKTLSGRLGNGLSYSSNLSWNSFPAPAFTEKNMADLTRGAEDILLAREAHFPATIADLYDPENMPDDLRRAHDSNDEILERIYIGRRFKNDTERLEKLFDLYTKMTAGDVSAKQTNKKAS